MTLQPRRPQGLHYADFARRLRAAMGLGAAAGALFSVEACGGKVIIDNPVDEGTGGSTSASHGTGTQASSSTGPSNFECNVEVPPNFSEIYGCLASSPALCPGTDNEGVLKELGAALNSSTCDPGGSCCTQNSVAAVVCGPDPTVDECCYIALMSTSTNCEGRPFTVDGAARTASLASRADWGASPSSYPAPSMEGLDEATRRELADAWAKDALAEHASVASFARFALELLAVGAPADLVTDAHKAIGDEIRHAKLSFSLASAYAGSPVGPSPLRIDGALAGRSDLAEVAAAVVREGCINETAAALLAAASRDAAEDPAVKSALSSIAPDEEAHAALAWRFVAWALRSGDLRVRAAVEEAFAGARAYPAASGAPTAGALPEGSRALRAHGRLSEASQREVMERALREVILPCARAMLLDRPGSPRPVARA